MLGYLGKIVHGFKYDAELNRFYNDPFGYINKVAGFYAVATPDFSMDPRMSEAQIISATFRNRWCGSFCQSKGLKVITTVGWASPETYDITFAGIRDGAPLIISTLGINNDQCRDGFMDGYREMRRRFPCSPVISVGQRLDGMDDDVCYVEFDKTFGDADQSEDGFQQKLFNWDFSQSGGDDYGF